MCHIEVGRQTYKVFDDAIAVLSICSPEQLSRLQGAISREPIQEVQVALPIQESQEEDPTRLTLPYKEEEA